LSDVKSYWVYILHCDNDTYYTGYTNNLIRRYHEHLAGSTKCKYTRSFKPLRLAQCWYIPDDKSLCMKLESFIKNLSRTAKEEIILYPERLFNRAE
jgi:putative endonuclease